MTESRKKMLDYRRANHLCIECGERAKDGCTRCIGCLQYQAAMSKLRRARYTDEDKKAAYEYHKKWLADHPDNVKAYKNRKSEYNRRYTYGGLE